MLDDLSDLIGLPVLARSVIKAENAGAHILCGVDLRAVMFDGIDPGMVRESIVAPMAAAIVGAIRRLRGEPLALSIDHIGDLVAFNVWARA